MKVLLDKKIPYSDLFAESLKLDIDVFSDESFDISNVIEDSIVIVRSTYKTHGRDVSNNVKLLCSVSTGEDHIDKESLIAKGIPVKFSTGANAVAVKEYFLSSLAFLIKDQQFDVNGDRILIIGAGNIGSKVALKLIETGTDVFIMNSNKASSVQTSKAINILKPSECSNNAIPISLDNMIKMDCIGGFTRGIPVINKKIVRYLKKDGLIIDGGTDNISQDGIEEAKKRNLKIIKLDVRYGFESNFRLMRNTKNLKEEVSGRKKINGINMVAGGIIGNKGDIIVDNITFPKKILGIADGLGRFEKNIEDYSEIIKKAEKTIKKKN